MPTNSVQTHEYLNEVGVNSLDVEIIGPLFPWALQN